MPASGRGGDCSQGRVRTEEDDRMLTEDELDLAAPPEVSVVRFTRKLAAQVADDWGIPFEEIYSSTRGKAAVVRARSLIMWKARQAGFSLLNIGHAFDRDHTSVRNAIRTIDKLMNKGSSE